MKTIYGSSTQAYYSIGEAGDLQVDELEVHCSLFLQYREYGGPEEGGWHYDALYPVSVESDEFTGCISIWDLMEELEELTGASLVADEEDNALVSFSLLGHPDELGPAVSLIYAAFAGIADIENKDRREISSVLSDGIFIAILRKPIIEPTVKPLWE